MIHDLIPQFCVMTAIKNKCQEDKDMKNKKRRLPLHKLLKLREQLNLSPKIISAQLKLSEETYKLKEDGDLLFTDTEIMAIIGLLRTTGRQHYSIDDIFFSS